MVPCHNLKTKQSTRKKGIHWWVAKLFEKLLILRTWLQKENYQDTAEKLVWSPNTYLFKALRPLSPDLEAPFFSGLPNQQALLPFIPSAYVSKNLALPKGPSCVTPQDRSQPLQPSWIHEKWLISTQFPARSCHFFNTSKYSKPTSWNHNIHEPTVF